MGRGLSELQKSIVTLALRSYEPNRTGGADLYYSEIFAEVYQWQPTLSPLRGKPSTYMGYQSDGRRPGSQHFSKAAIGAKTYNSAQAAVSRAVTRLWNRGLVTPVIGARSRWSGLNLTETGAKAAHAVQVQRNERQRGGAG